MPRIPDQSPTGFSPQLADPKITFGAQEAPDVWGAAFRMENDVVNFIEIVEDRLHGAWKRDPNFNLVAALRENDMWEDYRRNFIGVGSQEEFNHILGKIRREEADRRILQSAGLPGLLASVTAGVLSPVSLLPFTGGAKGAVAIRNAAAWGFAGGVLQEIPLQLNQITRTGEETAFSVTASTVLGGVLGGAAALLRRGELEELARQLDEAQGETPVVREGDMANRPGQPAISETEPRTNPLERPRVGEAANEIAPRVVRTATDDELAQLESLPDRADVVRAADTALSEVLPQLPESLQARVNKFFENAEGDTDDLADILDDADEFLQRNGRTVTGLPELVDKLDKVKSAFTPEQAIETRRLSYDVWTNEYTDVPLEVLQALKRGEEVDFERGFFKLPVRPPPSPIAERALDDAIAARTAAPAGEVDLGVTLRFGEVPPHSLIGANAPSAAVSAGGGQPGSLGAAAARRSAGRLQQGLGISKLAQIGPVTRTLQQTLSRQAQWMMAQLANAGLRLEGNKFGVPTTVGGTAENRIKTYYSIVARGYHLGDELFAEYWFDQPVSRLKGLTAGIGSRPDKLSKVEFREQVGQALFSEDKHAIPQVQQAAEWWRNNLYNPLLEKGQAAGMFKNVKADELAEDTDDLLTGVPAGDLSYLNRVYKDEIIRARGTRFVDILATHFEQKLQASFQKQLGKLIERQARDTTLAEDIGRPADEVAELRRTFQEELKFIDEAATPDEADLEDFIAAARSQARDKSLTPEQRKDARDMAKALAERGGEPLAKRAARRRELQRRIRNLNKSISTFTARQQAKLAKAERAEELQMNSLRRAIGSSQRFLRELDMLSDEAFEGRARELRNSFETLAQRYDSMEERLGRMAEDVEPNNFNEELLLLGKQEEVGGRMSGVAETLEGLENLDRALVRGVVEDGLNEVLRKVNVLNGKRARRAERLRDQANDLDPEVAKQRLASTLASVRERRDTFLDDWRTRGADLSGVDLPTTKADFSKYARGLAEETRGHILGIGMRLPGLDLIQDLRGAELARTLDIPSENIAEFLETDVERLAMIYTRTVAPDIEIRAKLGDLAPDMGKNLEFVTLREEQDAQERALTERLTAEGKSPEAIEKATLRLAAGYDRIRRDLEAVIGRLRGNYGLPKEPMGLPNRLGIAMRNLNTLRFMGSVTVSSIPDLARPIQKYGLTKAFRGAFLPLMRGMAQVKMTNRELRLAGAALDVTLHSRAHQMFDIGDHLVRGSKFEKSLEFAANRMGVLATFDYWTTAMKHIAGNTAILDIVDHVDQLVNKGSAKSGEALAAMGIDRNLADKMWAQMASPGGADKVNGTWFPNTENWKDVEAVDAFRAALVGQVDDTIITPGVERPLLMDSTPLGKMLFQFKSFGMSSTTKTLMAGLQQRDAAFVSGTMISLALGALSYYIWAATAGGDALEEALKLDPEKWADEAISRSGNLAVFAEVQDILSQIPLTQPYVTFSGQRTTRRGGEGLVESALGPSFDLITGGAAVLSGIDDPTQSTAHKLRLMLPLQNHFALRQLFDQIEAAGATVLPERRN